VVFMSDDGGDWHYTAPVVAWMVRADGTASPVIASDARSSEAHYGLILPDGAIDEEDTARYENLAKALEAWRKEDALFRAARNRAKAQTPTAPPPPEDPHAEATP
jgi:hypothetical protein